MTLLDTNILLRQAVITDPLYQIAVDAIHFLDHSDIVMVYTPQIVYEYWATATRPLQGNGLGFSIDQTLLNLKGFSQAFQFLPDKPNLFAEWEALVRQYKCHGKVSYDARHVAAMRTHNITRILTFNVGDFQRFPGITVLDPRTITIP